MAPATQTVHSEGEIFRLVRTGAAQSRADLARLTGLSPSTVALRVEELIARGYIEENGEGESRGGRRPRVLTVKAGGNVVVGVELGEQHATVALFDRRAEVVASTVAQVSLLDGVESVVNQVWECARGLAKENGGLTLEGIAMSLPGPVDSRTSRLLAPMRMPGWNGVDVGEVLGSVTGLPFLIDNDANAMAVGEFIERGGEQEQLVFVKAGSGIGCGIILEGAVYRGYRGVAGDISHVALHNAPPIICSCGRVGCLDVVASGAAIVDALREAGVAVETLDDVLALAQDAHPKATSALREAAPHGGGARHHHQLLQPAGARAGWAAGHGRCLRGGRPPGPLHAVPADVDGCPRDRGESCGGVGRRPRCRLGAVGADARPRQDRRGAACRCRVAPRSIFVHRHKLRAIRNKLPVLLRSAI